MKLYLCGRVSNNPHYKEEFAKAEGALSTYYEVLNPVNLGFSSAPEYWKDAMKAAIRLMMECDGVAIVDHQWVYSNGAKIEVGLARSIGMPMKFAKDWIEEAKRGADEASIV
jgi:hypothetical protein